MALYTEPYDTADYLKDDEDVIAYLIEAVESDDPRIIAKSIGTVARARGGMTQLARDTGISREALYRALSDNGNPEFATILKVLRALGVRISVSLAA
jgi:probable addiction module antidote protein